MHTHIKHIFIGVRACVGVCVHRYTHTHTYIHDYIHTYNTNSFKETHYYMLWMTYIWLIYYNELQNIVTLVPKKHSHHVITPYSPSRPHQCIERPYILSCHMWKISWRTFRATTLVNHRFHFFKLPCTSRSIALSTSCVKLNSLRAVRTFSLSYSTFAASSLMMSFAHFAYSGSTTSK